MKQLLRGFPELYQDHDEFKRRVDSYQRAVKSEDWKFLEDTILTIKGEIYERLLSAKFTDLPAEEKDIEQKTYYHLIQVLDFLKNPLGWIKMKRRWIDKLKRSNPKGSD